MKIDASLYSKHDQYCLNDGQRKRKFTRIHFDRQVNLDFFTDSYDSCQIKDLSLTGMYVLGSFQHHVGEHCLLNLIQTGSSSGLSLLASAKVIRKDDEGIAIEFSSMSSDSYMFLQVILLYEAEDPLFVGVELPENCPFEILDKLPGLPSANSLGERV